MRIKCLENMQISAILKKEIVIILTISSVNNFTYFAEVYCTEAMFLKDGPHHFRVPIVQ